MNDPSTPDRVDDPVISVPAVLFGDESLDELLDRVVELARLTLRSAHSVSIFLSQGHNSHTSNSTGPEALVVDMAQYEGGDGPCLEAIRTGKQVEVDVAQDGARWPEFQAKATEVGIGWVLSTPLVVRDEVIGALNVYSRRDRAFSRQEVKTARLFGEQASIALANTVAFIGVSTVNEQLRAALPSREVIGEAKGILMERENCTGAEAFDMLRRASQRTNRKLRDLAVEIVTNVEQRAVDPRLAKPGRDESAIDLTDAPPPTRSDREGG
jgi:GAF domain-containing protein